jgi:hypothetical protein
VSNGGFLVVFVASTMLGGLAVFFVPSAAAEQCILERSEQRNLELVGVESIDGSEAPDTERMRWSLEGILVRPLEPDTMEYHPNEVDFEGNEGPYIGLVLERGME